MNIALPRVETSAASTRRASTGAATSVGIKEHIVFPEIDYDKADESGAWTDRLHVRETDDEARASAGVQLSVPA